MARMIAVGAHVFAGGYTQGVLDEFDVPAQVEIHDLGRKSVEAMGVCFIREKRWERWPKIDASFVFGNPRCSGFSSMTSMGASRGPWCTQTKDIHDLCEYALSIKADVVAWESVRGAYTVGRELLNYLTNEMFIPRGYRIAHVFERGIDFGNSQERRRYFYVAYKGIFNAEPPTTRGIWVKDAIAHMLEVGTNETRLEIRNAVYDANSHNRVNDDLRKCIPFIQSGLGLNEMASRDDGETLEFISEFLHEKWLFRSSVIPFGTSGAIPRLKWEGRCFTLHGGCSYFVHPLLDRTITVGEASALMGWGERVPSGDYPMRQLAKGIIPGAGRWLARYVRECIEGRWTEDFGIRKHGERYDTTGHDEKIIYAEAV